MDEINWNSVLCLELIIKELSSKSFMQQSLSLHLSSYFAVSHLTGSDDAIVRFMQV